MASWSHPASSKTAKGPAMTRVPRSMPANTKDDIDLLTRTSWVNAEVAYKQIKKGKSNGNTCALWVRCHLQKQLFSVGCFIQLHYGKVLFLGLLLLSLFCFGLKTGTLETNVEQLWVEQDGRLSKERDYTRKTIGEGSGTTYEVIIQTPENGLNILSVESMLLHLQAVMAAAKIEVKLYDITWSLHDICYAPSSDIFVQPYLEKILTDLLPCMIISPLDCFWEGAKLFGPENHMSIMKYSNNVKWTNLNPREMVEKSDINNRDVILDVMDRAGIKSGYLEKPCLNPKDPKCPNLAPNKQSGLPPDIGAELTNGCTGFATKYMHWQEDLIIGGIRRNKTNHIVRAEALQSIIQLMGEKDMFEYYQNVRKVRTIDWTMNKAKMILETWHRKFTAEVDNIYNGKHQQHIHVFSSTSLADIMEKFSSVSVVRIALGYIVMLLYACISLLKCNDAVNSQCVIGIAGVLLVGLSVAAGLGLCSVLGIKFNASTTQIVPFLALGLGVDDMFLIAHTYAENSNNIPFMERTGECLKRTGVSVLLTSVTNIMGFLAAAIIPIPALRAFSLQAAILVFFNLSSILLILPAVVSWDLVRREDKRIDVFCCFQSSMANQVIELQPQRDSEHSLSHFGFTSTHLSIPNTSSSVAIHQTVTKISVNGSQPVTCLAMQPTERVVNQSHSTKPVHSEKTQKAPVPEKHSKALVPEKPQKTPAPEKPLVSEKTPNALVPEKSPCVLVPENPTNALVPGKPSNALVPEKYPRAILPEKSPKLLVSDKPLKVLFPDNSLKSVLTEKPPIQNPVYPPACPSNTSSRQCLTPIDTVSFKDCWLQMQHECFNFSLANIVKNHYGPFLQKTPTKVFTIVVFLIITLIGIYGITLVEDGLELTDIVPHGTAEYNFLEAKSKYFGFYNFFAVTKNNFDYAHNQKLLYSYHKAFQQVNHIIKREDGSLPTFWLQLFREWLHDLQKSFDNDVATKCIGPRKWYQNASQNGILAFRLLAQTGNVDDPFDVNQVHKVRLVKDGIINPSGFYNYLSAWRGTDVLGYDSAMGDFYPPLKSFVHDYRDRSLEVFKSHQIQYAQLPFYLTNLSNTSDMIETVRHIRSICKEFEGKGLPNYPRGVPFTYWEQYLHLRMYLSLSILCILIMTFLVIAIILVNLWIAVIVMAILLCLVLQLLGFMGIAGIKLSAVPAVTLVIAVGIGMEFIAHVCIGFITSVGSRDRRMLLALEHTFVPVVHGGMSTLLGIIMLIGAEFDFIIKYIFNVLSVLVLLGLLNGLWFLPVLLSVIGPPGEIVPKDNGDMIEPPTPEPSPRPRERPIKSVSRHIYPRMPSDISLSTITEEPTQYSSHEIIVQPEVVVETTTIPITTSSTQTKKDFCDNNFSYETPQVPTKHITRVKATATVKVEVHTPLPGAVEQEHSYKSKRRKLKEQDSSDSDGSK
ncbi:protein patched homolog 1-like [Octopus vulgaris]|uniref:Protein patched homolog 1-like n=1 Tax=Octopus vulgaris TaxID=6645 RepID=A0AA36F608_OCTVU|nr:protein patched homolog 1-like [Octopus vulgaris]